MDLLPALPPRKRPRKTCEHCPHLGPLSHALYYSNHHQGKCQLPVSSGQAPEEAEAPAYDREAPPTETGELDQRDQSAAGADSFRANDLREGPPGLPENPAHERDTVDLQRLLESLDEEALRESMEESAARETNDAAGQPAVRQQQPARPGSAAHYQQHAHHPLYAGSRCTVRQACHAFLSMKQEHNQRDTHFDISVRFLSTVVLPVGNLLPPSLYLIQKVLDIPEPRSCAYHVCPGDDHSWPYTDPSQWEAHRNDTCPICGAARFRNAASPSLSLQPAKEFWYTGLASAVRDLFLDPDWVVARNSEQMQPHTAADLLGAQMCTRINDATGGKLLQPTSLGIEMGYDDVQIFTFKTHSTGVWAIRGATLPDNLKGKGFNVRRLGIIPGKDQPKHIEPYLRPFMIDLVKYGPSGPGLQVQELCKDDRGCYHLQERTVTIFLLGIAADSIARIKLAATLGVSAFLACGWCVFQGQRFEGSTAMRFAGYSEPATQDILGLDPCHVGDPGLRLSDEDQRERAAAVEAYHRGEEGGVEPSLAGCHGHSPVAHPLDYASYNDLFMIPIFHAGLYGLLKKFCGMLLEDYSKEAERNWYSLNRSSRATLRERGGRLRLTADFYRPFREMTQYWKSWYMDEWLHFLETYSVYLFTADLMDQRMWDMWCLLRCSLLHYLRVTVVNDDPVGPGSSFHETERVQAHEDLHKYASLVQQHLPAHMLTFNLHIMVCRPHLQELARGNVGKDNEGWVEREMQKSKRPVKYRTTAHPEKLAVHELLRERALHAQWQLDKVLSPPAQQLRSFDEWVPAYRADMRAGPLYDTGDAASGTQMLGKGKPMEGEHKQAAVQQIVQLRQRMPDVGWPADADVLASARLDSFSMAHKRGEEIVWSLSNARISTRTSYLCQLRFATANREVTYVAEIREFIRALLPDQPALRLASCRLMRASATQRGLRVSAGQVASTEMALVEIDRLDGKLVTALEDGAMYAVPYSNASGMG